MRKTFLLLVISISFVSLSEAAVRYPDYCFSDFVFENYTNKIEAPSSDFNVSLWYLTKGIQPKHINFALNDTLYIKVNVIGGLNKTISNLAIDFILEFPSNKTIKKEIFFSDLKPYSKVSEYHIIGNLTSKGVYKPRIGFKYKIEGGQKNFYSKTSSLFNFRVSDPTPCENHQYHIVQIDDFSENIRVTTKGQGCFEVVETTDDRLDYPTPTIPVHTFVILWPLPGYKISQSLSVEEIVKKLGFEIDNIIIPHSEGLCTISIKDETLSIRARRPERTTSGVEFYIDKFNNSVVNGSINSYTPEIYIPPQYSKCYQSGDYLENVEFNCSLLYHGKFLFTSAGKYPDDTYTTVFGFYFPHRSFVDIDYIGPSGKVLTSEALGFTNKTRLLKGNYTVDTKRIYKRAWRDFNRFSWRDLDTKEGKYILAKLSSASFLSSERANLLLKPFELFLYYSWAVLVVFLILIVLLFIGYLLDNQTLRVSILEKIPTDIFIEVLLALFIGCVISYVFNIFSISRPTCESSDFDIKFGESIYVFILSLLLLLLFYVIQKTLYVKNEEIFSVREGKNTEELPKRRLLEYLSIGVFLTVFLSSIRRLFSKFFGRKKEK